MDGLRVVTLSAGGRPVQVANIEDGTTYTLLRGTFKMAPGQKRQQSAQMQTRYGGGRVVGESQENGSVSGTWLIAAATNDLVNTAVEALLAQVDNAGAGRMLEWIPDGSTRGVYFELRGPGQYSPQYEWVEYAGAQVAKVELTWPVAPLPRLLPLDIGDPFDVDSLSDYTADVGSKADLAIAGGVLTATANLAAEKALLHSARGHPVGDHEETLKFTPGATITSFKAGVRLKCTAANTYLEVYVDDNGTNSRLRIDKVVAGVRTNLQTTNLAARVSNGTAGWVRGRIEGNVVAAEYFTAQPTPMGAPTLAPAAATLAGGDITAFGLAVTGGRGLSWIPQHAAATLDDYCSRPYTYRNQTLPQTIALRGDIPGRAPALCDVVITPSGGAAAPIWALVGWTERPSAPIAGVAPFGIVEAEAFTFLSNWAVTADAAMRGGSKILDATVSGAESYIAGVTIDPATLVSDDFTQGDVDVEIWADVILSSTLVSPKLTIVAFHGAGPTVAAERYSHEWGSAGKLLTKPSAGTVKRFVRLGTVTLYVDRNAPLAWAIQVRGSTAAGSTGVFGLDYVTFNIARKRALGPTSKPNDASYPKFVNATTETTKRVRSDLSALLSVPPANGYPDHGLGGNLIELPTGPVDALMKLSSLVPDDPTSDATSEQLTHAAAVHFAVVPRVRMLNG